METMVRNPVSEFRMKRPLPRTSAQWLKEIKLAIADAAGAAPFGPLVGTEVTAANLFHLAPVVCLKFRGRKLKGREADRVIKVALANYVANSDPEGIDHGLEQRPLMAFTLCYVAAHLALDLVDEEKAEAILTYCENHL
jgi:hypothetical protein